MKIAIKFLLFTVVFALIFGAFTELLTSKGSHSYKNIRGLEEVGKNELDVLFVGSCHIHYNVQPMQLWDEFGIPAYNISTSAQRFAVSLLSIKEALKTQSPKVIVLDVLAAAYENTYMDQEYIDQFFQENMDAFPLSFNKIVTAMRLTSKRQAELAFGLLYNKGGWSSIDKNNFVFESSYNTRGAEFTPSKPIGERQKAFASQAKKIDSNEELYLKQIIELCKENDIDLVLVKSPYSITEIEQKNYLYIEQIAQDNGVPFLNFNNPWADKMFSQKDFSDLYHLNFSGKVKYTHALGQYLADNYHLQNKRGVRAYEHWNQDSIVAQCVTKQRNLKDVLYFEEYLALLSDPNYLICIVVYDEATNALSDEMRTELEALGLTLESLDQYGTGYLAVIDSETVQYENFNKEDSVKYITTLNDINIQLKSTGYYAWKEYGKNCEVNIMLDGQEYAQQMVGFNIVVYDKILRQVVDSVAWDTYSTHNAARG